jgi:hypothetical protein
MLLLFIATLDAQVTRSASRYYYAIENLVAGRIERRGLTSRNGIPSNGLILSPNTRFRERPFQADRDLVRFAGCRTPAAGSRSTVPPIALHPPLSPDTDADGLSVTAESTDRSRDNPLGRILFTQ